MVATSSTACTNAGANPSTKTSVKRSGEYPIKTPLTRLIGSRYRANAYSMSEELSGAVVQTLNYRDELLKNFHALTHAVAATQFSAFNPQCLVVVGSLENEDMDVNKRRSFELFRSNLGAVTILTFDQIFGKVRDLVDLLSDE